VCQLRTGTTKNIISSEGEVFIGWLFRISRRLRCNVFLRFLVNRVGMNNNRTRRRRAGQLTSATADAVLLVDLRIKNIFPVRKADGMRRTNFSAGTAIVLFHVDHAEIFPKFRLAYLSQLFISKRDSGDRAGGANTAAHVAFIVAITLLIIHLRLQNPSRTVI